MFSISGAGVTHPGLVRGTNEDAGFVGASCLLVADGVGGGAAGEVASATTAYAVCATALQGGEPLAVLTKGVLRAQSQLSAGVVADPRRSGMATTLTALVTDGHSFALAHLGDSRGYLFRDGTLQRITRDHTYVQDLVDRGELDPQDVPAHPWRNVVLRSVNAAIGEPADVTSVDLKVGDRVLLASDGLTDLVSEQWVEELLSRTEDDAAAESLLAAALEQGGRDNITVLVATIIDAPLVTGDGRLLGSATDPVNVIDLAAIRSA